MYNQWCTIESDPGVFTELISQLGVPSAQVEEVYSMDDDPLINKIKPEIYGFIFLFKWTKNNDSREPLMMYDQDLFFARQIVTNACATQAILSVLLNASVKVEGVLKDYYQFTKFLPSQDKGLALSNSQAIKSIHNSFSRPEPFIFKQDKKAKKKADAFHFISYVPHKNHLYELDGLQPGPIMIGKFETKEQWIELAKKQISARILKYSEKQIRFNLLVVCENLKSKKIKEIQSLQAEKAGVMQRLKTLGRQVDEDFLKKFETIPEINNDNIEELQNRLTEVTTQIEEDHLFCEEEDIKNSQRKEENIRRKHNYVPMILGLLKVLAKKDKLGEIIQKAKEKNKKKA